MRGYWWNKGGASSPSTPSPAADTPLVTIPKGAEPSFDTTSDAIYRAEETPWLSRVNLSTNNKLFIEWHSRGFHFGDVGFLAYFPKFYVTEDGVKKYTFSPYPYDETGVAIPSADIAAWIIGQMNTNTPSLTNPPGGNGKPITIKFVSKYVGVKGAGGSNYVPPVIGQDASKNSKLCYLLSSGLSLQGTPLNDINVWGTPLFTANFTSGARLAVGNPLWRGPGTFNYISPQVMTYVEYREGGASIA